MTFPDEAKISLAKKVRGGGGIFMIIFHRGKVQASRGGSFLSLEGSGTEVRDAPTPKHRSKGGMLYDITVVSVVVKFAQGTSLFEVFESHFREYFLEFAHEGFQPH